MHEPPADDRFIDSAINSWTRELIDLGGRNNLLYFRDLAVGTLDLSGQDRLLAEVLAGQYVAVSSSYQDPARAEKSAATIRAKAKETYEERGLATMHIASGFVTWDEESDRKTPPTAPLVLLPVELMPLGSATSLSLHLTGDAQVNPVLLRKLGQEHGASVPLDQLDTLLADVQSLDDLQRVYEFLVSSLAVRVPGLALQPGRTVLGNFSYAKLPMVQDLEQASEELARHDLVCALAGDHDARDALHERNSAGAVSIARPDYTPPASEFLILDADASQSHAINEVLAGKDLIIQGPPGTGKSQTIANMIACLAAEGKSVLFVAEKRAAIDAVFRRLKAVGLSDILLDMHEGYKKRGEFAQALTDSMTKQATAEAFDFTREHEALTASRQALNDRAHSQYGIREPWEVSVYDARVRLAGFDAAAASEIRYHGEPLMALTADVIDQVQDLIEEWYDLGGMQQAGSDSLWNQAVIDQPGQAEAAVELARSVARSLGDAAAARDSLSRAGRFSPAATLAQWKQQMEVMQDLQKTFDVFDPQVMAQADDLLEQLSEADKSGLAARVLGSRAHRAADKQATALLLPGVELSAAARDEQMRLAILRRDQWRELTGSDQDPTRWDGLEAVSKWLLYMTQSLTQLDRRVPGLHLVDRPLGDLPALLERLSTDAISLGNISRIQPVAQEIEDRGFGPVLQSFLRDGLALDHAQQRLDHIWLHSIIEYLQLHDQWVAASAGPDDTVARFQEFDRDHITSGAARVRRACAERSVAVRNQYADEDTLVERQSRLKPRSRSHLPVRSFFDQAPHVLQALKPCWAMSPLVVSQTLPAIAGLFDVVIFDEASQVTPADAVCAILRGKQLVVAGDSRQLPPTNFFASQTPEEDGELVDGTSGFESILDALTGIIDERMLLWHYRSQDESLIAFSNRHIYGNSLTTFPGAGGSARTVRHISVPWVQRDPDTPDTAEAQRVVDLIVEHVLQRPSETLGVITMGVAHAEAITEALEAKRQELQDPTLRPRLDAFFDEKNQEAFFIKNLERVQGDERDAIILSIGYSKDPVDGRMVYRFGPLLQEGGERRLNVAVTRAKKRVTLVSSFTAGDMEPSRLGAEGSRLLREYLAYAEDAGNADPEGDAGELGNPLEQQIFHRLVEGGMQIVPRLGTSNYRLDFAVRHPQKPGEYLMVIETDGDTYHSSPTTRERDRLRQQQLEHLGWYFTRLWTSNWVSDPEAEAARIQSVYQRLAAGEEVYDPHKKRSAERPRSRRESSRSVRPATPGVPQGPKPKVHRSDKQHDIVEMIRWIQSDTLPRTDAQLVADTIAALGFARPGPRITLAVEDALASTRDHPEEDPSTPVSDDLLLDVEDAGAAPVTFDEAKALMDRARMAGVSRSKLRDQFDALGIATLEDLDRDSLTRLSAWLDEEQTLSEREEATASGRSGAGDEAPAVDTQPEQQAAATDPVHPPAGWYADPGDPEVSERYWDGSQWTHETRLRSTDPSA